jgi:hypothetical protein
MFKDRTSEQEHHFQSRAIAFAKGVPESIRGVAEQVQIR